MYVLKIGSDQSHDRKCSPLTLIQIVKFQNTDFEYASKLILVMFIHIGGIHEDLKFKSRYLHDNRKARK